MSEPSASGLEAQARAAVDRIVALGVDNDTARARAVYAELAALAAAHPEEASLRLWLGWAAFRLVSGHVEPPIAAEAQAVIDDLAAVAAAHPAEPNLREMLARALAHHVHNRLQANDVAGARAAHAELSALSAAHPDESKMQEELGWSLQAMRLFGF